MIGYDPAAKWHWFPTLMASREYAYYNLNHVDVNNNIAPPPPPPPSDQPIPNCI